VKLLEQQKKLGANDIIQKIKNSMKMEEEKPGRSKTPEVKFLTKHE
jgi:hypothetical protein